jgi:hypothetical protein
LNGIGTAGRMFSCGTIGLMLSTETKTSEERAFEGIDLRVEERLDFRLTGSVTIRSEVSSAVSLFH